MLLLSSIMFQLFTYAMECGHASFCINNVFSQLVFIICCLIEWVEWEGDFSDLAFSHISQDKCSTDYGHRIHPAIQNLPAIHILW